MRIGIAVSVLSVGRNRADPESLTEFRELRPSPSRGEGRDLELPLLGVAISSPG